MPTIDIIIRDKTASAVNPPCIVCGNSDYNVKFNFDEEWQEHNNKIGVFAYNRCGEWQSEKVLFEGDTCPVPALHGVRSVWIGVTAGDVRTSTPADVPCRMGATDFSDTDEPPSADVWGQILAKLDELQTEIDEIKEGGGAAQTDLNAAIATVNEAVLYTEQTLENSQKRQARKNIGANGVTITGANEEITPYDNSVYQAIVAELEGVQNITLVYNNDKIKMQYWEKTGASSYALFFDTAVVSGENVVRKSYEVEIAPSAGTVTEHITPAIKPDDKPAIKATEKGALYRASMTGEVDTLGENATNLGVQIGAIGKLSFSMGSSTTASGFNSASFGGGTKASGFSSASFGSGTTASGEFSTSFGSGTTASGKRSAAFGTQTYATENDQFVCGKYNNETTDKNCIFVVGSGSSKSAKKNAFAVRTNGEIVMPDPNATNTTYMKARFNSDGTITLIPLADETKSYTTECTANRVTAITAESTDAQYPTAKAVYDAIQAAIANLNNTGE